MTPPLTEGHILSPYMQDGESSLTLASYRGHTEVVKVLLEHHADVNAQDKVRHSDLLSDMCRVDGN